MTDLRAAQELASGFSDLSTCLRTGDDRGEALQRLVDLAVRAVPGCAWAGVTSYSPGRGAGNIASSDWTSEAVDLIQSELDEGPCVTAALSLDLAPIRIDDLTRDDRWPDFRAHVLEHTPVRSVLSFHLPHEGVLDGPR